MNPSQAFIISFVTIKTQKHMSNKFEIVNKKWIVKFYEKNAFDYESSIRIAAVTGVEIQHVSSWKKLTINQ